MACWSTGCTSTTSETASSLDEEVFFSPDSSFYPGVWWWWLRCKTSKEAITRDLEEMKAKKIQRMIHADFGTGGGQPLTGEYLELASPEWNEMVKHAIRECKRLGLDFGICTESSGASAPWVAWENGQQRLTHVEMRVEGPISLKTQLPYASDIRKGEDGLPVCYRDISVLAMPDRETVIKEDIRDISSGLNQAGELHWEVPAGKWKIVRFGFIPTFQQMNEFVYQDHLRTDIYNDYYKKYFGDILNELTAEERSAVKIIESDSYEAGVAEWSQQFVEDFIRLRKYDPTSYLPVLSGQTVESKEISERFLYDYRQTISDLIVDHYRYLQELANKDGLLTLLEASGPHQHWADALLCQKFADLPMGEFWAPAKTHRTTLPTRFMAKEAVSAAHIYGKTIIPAESFTSIGPQWEEDPWTLKSSADRAFCEGVNQIYFHTFSHSPSLTAKPGYVYYAGSHFNRNITWWDYAYDWIAYLTRCQYMLQQGLPVADVCFYYGDGIKDRKTYRQETPLLGDSYHYDYTNSDAILERMTARNGKIYLPDGMSYNILILPNEKAIPLEVLEKIRDLVSAGITIIGAKPEKSTGLYQYEENDRKVKKIAAELWGSESAGMVDRAFGKGRVICGKSIREVLADKKILPDMEYASCRDSSAIDYIHRTDGDAEIYYLANLTEQSDYVRATFRITGKTPQIWNPADGSVTDLPVYADDGERISMPLYFDPFGSMFIVFREKEETPHITSVSVSGENIFPQLPAQIPDTEYYSLSPDGKLLFRSANDVELKYNTGQINRLTPPLVYSQEIPSPWQVSFSEEWGGPAHITFDKLISWTESETEGIKYYSGTAVYTNTFTVDESMMTAPPHIELHLGEVYHIAEVIINGKNLGTCWKKPFRKDISSTVVPGKNTIELKIVNLWPNRLIGDSGLSEKERYTETNVLLMTTYNINSKFRKDAPLLPSGLLGPVRLDFMHATDLNKE
jgi:hypothetical protein